MDEVDYLYDLYYGELEFLRTKQDLLREIIDNVDSNSGTYMDAESKLEDVAKSLKKLEGIVLFNQRVLFLG